MALLFRGGVWYLKGLSEFTSSGYKKASRHFNNEEMDKDMSGKVAVITGANSGLGKETTTQLVKRGATVHMLCRNQERGEQAKEEISVELKKATNRTEDEVKKLMYVSYVDLSRPKTILDWFDKFQKENSASLDILINNAGCMINELKRNEEGNEENWATNVLGTFILTEKLVPLMRERSKTTGVPSRVITVSSGGMYTVSLDAKDPQSEKAFSSFDGTMIYAQNKRQQVELTNFWAEKYSNEGIVFLSMHPGWAATPAVAASMPSFYEKMKDKLRTVQEGADTIVWASISDLILKTVPNGSFLQDRKAVFQHLFCAFTKASAEDRKTLYDYCLNKAKKYL